MQIVDKLDKWYGKKVVRGVAILVAALAAYLLFFTGSASVEDTEVAAKLPTVTVATAADASADNTATFVGTVRAVSEADIQTDRGGRVTSVRVTAGSRVAPGTVIATLENASEQAAVLQAQGSYEAAVAGSAQGNVGINEAQNAKKQAQDSAVSTYKNAYTTVSGIVYTSLDQFYSNPKAQIPGVKVGTANTTLQNNERAKLNTTLPAWQGKTVSLTSDGDLKGALNEAEATTKQVLVLVDDFISAFARTSANKENTDLDYQALGGSFNGLRSQLVATLASIDAARSGLDAADEAINRAQIAGTGSQVSSADAQIKIALGSLRSAQANLEKTILRSPIGGVVEVLRIKTGDFLTPQTSIARVAGAQGLEVSIFAGENDRNLFAVGDTVRIGTNATGTVVNIAPAIDSETQKTEIKVAVEGMDLVNGDTVSVSLGTTTSRISDTIQVPITALKFTDTAGSVFVVENNRLKQVPVEVGPISGSLVTILGGIEATTEFVVDARGRVVDEEVTVVRN